MPMGRNGKEDAHYSQPTLAVLEAPQAEETELDNCLVLSRPEYKDTGKKRSGRMLSTRNPVCFTRRPMRFLIASASHDLAISARHAEWADQCRTGSLPSPLAPEQDH